ncbi:MAG TPA: 2Fe-2S iron-sulfur cluster-binding protein [Polyangiaceae bacterium LLY-WYZ-14_1]|jgi:adenylate cyclase|nr:2Fe-2S iron-sulfur cluster-binding protein [Polyangiaceae bacterium LLY-WYZ-14_1]
MVKIHFQPAGVDAYGVLPGTYLNDVTEAYPESSVPYSCKSAACGTCRVQVVQGAEAFDPPEDDELEVLEAFGDGPEVRLCCQLQVARNVPQIVLRVVEPD